MGELEEIMEKQKTKLCIPQEGKIINIDQNAYIIRKATLLEDKKNTKKVVLISVNRIPPFFFIDGEDFDLDMLMGEIQKEE